MNNQKANDSLGLKKIRNSKMLIICGVLLVMVILCGMSEARIGGDISNTLPNSLGTLQGYGDFNQLNL